MRRAAASLWLGLGLVVAWVGNGQGIPPAPSQYVTDEAGVLSPGARAALNQQLRRFEDDTSNQILVYLARSLPQNTELSDYVRRVATAWKLGQAQRNNGALLAVFINDHKSRIEVGRGLEGAMPDVVASRILRNELGPRFSAGDYDGGVRSAVNAMIAATKGEYKGGGRNKSAGSPLKPRDLAIAGMAAVAGAVIGALLRGSTTPKSGLNRIANQAVGGVVGGVGHGAIVLLYFAGGAVAALIAAAVTYSLLMARPQSYGYGGRGISSGWGGGLGGWGGGGWGGGGSGGGGGGSDSGFGGGGGGSFGGGGASGSW